MSDDNGFSCSSPSNWFPLATHQLRLRSISEIHLFHPSQSEESDKLDHLSPSDDNPRHQTSCDDKLFHLTFHETALSSPFYTTKRVCLQEERLTWTEIDQVTHTDAALSRLSGVRGCIIRIWREAMSGQLENDNGVSTEGVSVINDSETVGDAGENDSEKVSARISENAESVSVWGVYFSGLLCVGNKLRRKITKNFATDTLVFRIQSNYFVPRECIAGFPPCSEAVTRYIEIPGIAEESGKNSYDKTALRKMHWTLRALKQRAEANRQFKQNILTKGVDPQSAGVLVTATSTSLRQQIFAKQSKLAATRKKEVRGAMAVETQRLRVMTLREERERLERELKTKQRSRSALLSDCDSASDSLTDHIHSLAKDRERLSEWRAVSGECGDSCRAAIQGLTIRRHQLISQLSEIFPISDADQQQPTLCYVVLPGAEALKDRDDTDVSVALGWCSHLVSMVSSLLGVPLRYPVNANGSRSSIVDNILEKIPDKDREFPLYTKGVERVRFEYGVYLLNKNVAQLRWYCGEVTQDLRPTLTNLRALLDLCSSREAVDESPARYKLPPCPPILAGVSHHLPRRTPTHSTSSGGSGGAGKALSARNGPEEKDEEEAAKEEADDDSSKSSDSSDMNTCDNEDDATTEYITVTQENSTTQIEMHSQSREGGGRVEGESEKEEAVVTNEKNGTDEAADKIVVQHIEDGQDASDLFWGDVTSRAQALSVPASFRQNKAKHRTFK